MDRRLVRRKKPAFTGSIEDLESFLSVVLDKDLNGHDPAKDNRRIYANTPQRERRKTKCQYLGCKAWSLSFVRTAVCAAHATKAQLKRNKDNKYKWQRDNPDMKL